MPMQGGFDASGIEPKQSAGGHPPGMFDAQISMTSIKPTKDNSGGMFVVEFTTPSGSIETRYNIWNQSAQAVEIAQKQLSALCHALGIFKLDWQNDGAALRGGRCRIEVAPQKNNPDYVEVKKVFDVNGNEPGKPPSQGQQQPQQGGWSAPPQGQPNQNPAPQTNNAPPQGNTGGGWGAPTAPNQSPPQGQPAQGWTQQPQGQGNTTQPPWAKN